MNNRRRGALIGLAVGDALGAAVEFKSPGSFAPVASYRSGGPHRLEAGEWTDDTSMALALADSIATVGWDLNDQADRYVQWWKTATLPTWSIRTCRTIWPGWIALTRKGRPRVPSGQRPL